MKRGISALALACASLFCALPASATNFSFTGTFLSDDEIQLFNFTADGSSTIYLVSYGYGGGTQADGNVVPAGGFDPIISLFDSSGTAVSFNDDGSSTCFSAASAIAGSGGSADPVTGDIYDTCFSSAISAGDYIVALTQYDNFALGDLSDGFQRDGQSSFTSSNGCTNGQFCDINGDNRTSAWAFDILNVSQANAPGNSVPEPPTVLLLLAAMMVAGRTARSRVG